MLLLDSKTVLDAKSGEKYLFRNPDTLLLEIVRCEVSMFRQTFRPGRYIYFTRDTCPCTYTGDDGQYADCIQHIRPRHGWCAVHTREEFCRMFLMGDYRIA